jgi:hypothetical protein
MFNAFHHASFCNPNASMGAATTGQMRSTQPARSMQLAMKVLALTGSPAKPAGIGGEERHYGRGAIR